MINVISCAFGKLLTHFDWVFRPEGHCYEGIIRSIPKQCIALSTSMKMNKNVHIHTTLNLNSFCGEEKAGFLQSPGRLRCITTVWLALRAVWCDLMIQLVDILSWRWNASVKQAWVTLWSFYQCTRSWIRPVMVLQWILKTQQKHVGVVFENQEEQGLKLFCNTAIAGSSQFHSSSHNPFMN